MAEKCPCKGDYLDKLVQPAILSVLCEGPAYGLELLRELERRHLADGADVTRLLPLAQEARGRRQAQLRLADGERRAPPARIHAHRVRPPLPEERRRTLHAYLKDVRRTSAAVDAACELYDI